MAGFIVIVAVMALAPIVLFVGGAIWSAIRGDLLMHDADSHADDAHPSTWR